MTKAMPSTDTNLPEEDILIRTKNHFGLESTSKVTSRHIYEMIGIIQKSLTAGPAEVKVKKATDPKKAGKAGPRKTKDERLQEIIDRITAPTEN